MFAKLYAVALPIFFAIDMVWLAVISKGFYSKHLGFLMRDTVGWTSAITFYLIFIGSLVLFVILPAVESQSITKALFLGLAFGLVTYATYDLTNLATLKDWPLIVTVVDLIWGMTLSATVSVTTYVITTKFIIK